MYQSLHMEILAKNSAHINSRYDDSYIYMSLMPAVIVSLLLLCETCYLQFFTNRGGYWLLWLIGIALLLALVAIMNIDLYLRWHRAEEIVSVQHEVLVIEYSKCIFKRRKEIPLSNIRKVETYTGRSGWHWGAVPETLTLTYSNSIKYNFGICMTDSRRDTLARKIMELAQRYV